MRWVAMMLLGPTLWAIHFAAVYALHGLGCAWGWQDIATPVGTLHQTALTLGWLTGLGMHAVVVALAPRGRQREQYLPRMGAWIGLIASFVTLAPILFATSCGTPF